MADDGNARPIPDCALPSCTPLTELGISAKQKNPNSFGDAVSSTDSYLLKPIAATWINSYIPSLNSKFTGTIRGAIGADSVVFEDSFHTWEDTTD